MARRSVRILRARAFGTGLGGPGNPTDVAGRVPQAGSVRSGSFEDATQLMQFERLRAAVRRAADRNAIGSKGNL